MLYLTEFLIVSVLGSIFAVLVRFSSSWSPVELSFKTLNPFSLIPSPHFYSKVLTSSNEQKIKAINHLANSHEAAAILADLIHKDGAGSWPPRSNHDLATWPAALRPYREIYNEMTPLLPALNVSTDDNVNRERITNFRAHFRKLLDDKVDLKAVNRLLAAADAGQWDVFPRDAYNAFYACLAWCRHAYRHVSLLHPPSPIFLPQPNPHYTNPHLPSPAGPQSP